MGTRFFGPLRWRFWILFVLKLRASGFLSRTQTRHPPTPFLLLICLFPSVSFPMSVPLFLSVSPHASPLCLFLPCPSVLPPLVCLFSLSVPLRLFSLALRLCLDMSLPLLFSLSVPLCLFPSPLVCFCPYVSVPIPFFPFPFISPSFFFSLLSCIFPSVYFPSSFLLFYVSPLRLFPTISPYCLFLSIYFLLSFPSLSSPLSLSFRFSYVSPLSVSSPVSDFNEVIYFNILIHKLTQGPLFSPCRAFLRWNWASSVGGRKCANLRFVSFALGAFALFFGSRSRARKQHRRPPLLKPYFCMVN